MIQNNPLYQGISLTPERLKRLILESIVREVREIHGIPEGQDLEIQMAEVYYENNKGSLTLTFSDAICHNCSHRGRSYVVETGERTQQFAGFGKYELLDLLRKYGNYQSTNLVERCIQEMINDGVLIRSHSMYPRFIPSPAALSGIPDVRVISTGNPRAIVYHPSYTGGFKIRSFQ